MLNPTSPNAAAARARQPRGMVKIMGSDGGQPTPIVGWVRWEVEANGHYSADTFRVTFAAQLLPKDRNLAWMLSQSYLNVEILAGFPSDPAVFDASQLTSLIIGRCDSAEFDPVHNSIELHGRDYTAALIDSKTTDISGWPSRWPRSCRRWPRATV